MLSEQFSFNRPMLALLYTRRASESSVFFQNVTFDRVLPFQVFQPSSAAQQLWIFNPEVIEKHQTPKRGKSEKKP